MPEPLKERLLREPRNPAEYERLSVCNFLRKGAGKVACKAACKAGSRPLGGSGQNAMVQRYRSSVFDHTLGNAPHPVPNCEAKPQWACLVLGWGTTRESHGVERVLFCFCFCFLIFIFVFQIVYVLLSVVSQ